MREGNQLEPRKTVRRRFVEVFKETLEERLSGFVPVRTPRGFGGSRLLSYSFGSGFLHLEIQLDDLKVIARACISERPLQDIDPIDAGIPKPWPPEQPSDYFYDFQAPTTNRTTRWMLGLQTSDDASLEALADDIIRLLREVVVSEAERVLRVASPWS